MSIHSTSVYDLRSGLHRFAVYLVDANHQPVSNVFIKHFLIHNDNTIYFSENLMELILLD